MMEAISFDDWVARVVETLGSPGVGLLMFLENLFPPLPSELIMPLAGYVAARGGVSFWSTVIAGSVGSLAGAAAWYITGRTVGEPRMRRWIDAHGRWLTLSNSGLDRLTRQLQGRGNVAVLVGRLIPGVRTVISVPAGVISMPVIPFLLYTAIGTVIWTTALAYAGKFLGQHYHRIGEYGAVATWVVLGIAAIVYVVRLIRYKPQRKRIDPEDSHTVSL
jgi:membrane protein DedA with SNARE-associated domain